MNKGGTPQQVQPKYMHDYSKALSREMHILLAEVGKLKDEQQALQHEIAELKQMKAKHSPGGAYAADWLLPAPPPLLEAPLALEPPPPPPPARPAWRTVYPRPERRERPPRALKSAAAAPAPVAPPPPPPEPQIPAWAQWRPNPLLAPTPVNGLMSPPPQAPSRAGLFGPPTPPP